MGLLLLPTEGPLQNDDMKLGLPLSTDDLFPPSLRCYRNIPQKGGKHQYYFQDFSRNPIKPINQTDDLNVLNDPNDQNGINQTNPKN